MTAIGTLNSQQRLIRICQGMVGCIMLLFMACGGSGSSTGGDRPPNNPPAATVPSITTQPANLSVVAGQTAAFSVVASGTAPLSYQWRKGGSNITGATSTSYTTPTVTTADNNAQFTVVVTNGGGSVTSQPAILSVTATAVAPSITAQPMNQSVTVGQRAVFSVVASGTAPLAYQWKKGAADIGGANNSTYTTPVTITADSGTSFSVVVSNSVSSVTSQTATLTVNDGTGLFLDGFFLIGTFMPPSADFKKWKDRGVNTAVGEDYVDPATGIPNGPALQAWESVATTQGLRTIRRPMPNPSSDVGNTTLLAWSQMDEPDAAGAGMRNLASCIANYQQWKAADPNRPVYLNFAGTDVLSAIEGPRPAWCLDSTGGCSLVENHKDYINGALDWVSNDLYPAAGILNQNDESRRYDPSLVGDPIDRIRSWTDKPLFCFIETSDQKYTTMSIRGVTRDELRAEIWVAIVHGVRGYIFFPEVVPPSGVGASADGTPPDVAEELTIQNGIVTQLAPVLQGVINPSSLGATVPSPLQVCWRDAPGGRYFIVINPKATAIANASITLTGVGSATSATVFNESRVVALSSGNLTDTFAPYTVHIYVVAK